MFIDNLPLAKIDIIKIKNSTHSWDGVFGHGEWGIGHGEEVTNAPSGRAAIPLHPLKGIEFPTAFNEFTINANKYLC